VKTKAFLHGRLHYFVACDCDIPSSQALATQFKVYGKNDKICSVSKFTATPSSKSDLFQLINATLKQSNESMIRVKCGVALWHN